MACTSLLHEPASASWLWMGSRTPPWSADQEANGFNIHTVILGFSFSLRNGFSVILFSYIFKIKFSYF